MTAVDQSVQGAAADREDLEHADNDKTPLGHGRMLRKEDPRFIRGMGKYVDDLQLKGMLHLAILRSPVAHANIVSIDVERGPGPPEGEGGDHRRRPGRAGAGLDADPVQRRAGRARDRQGALPGPGGRVRGGGGPLLRARRARADRRGVRHASTGHRRTSGAGAGRTGDPRRPRGQDRQPLLRLGDGRQGRDRGGVREGRRRGDRGHRLSARPPRADGDLRLRRGLRAGQRPADAVDHEPGTARAPHGLRAGLRAARAQDPGDRARTSAAASATRCRSTPATCARSSRRW